MRELQSFLQGRWCEGTGSSQALIDPTTEAEIATVRSAQDLGAALDYARRVGGASLRSLDVRARGALLRRISKAIFAHRDELCDLAASCGGNTRGDAKFDIDGGMGVISAYADLADTMPEGQWHLEGEAEPVIRGGKLRVQHIRVARRGVAVHINAFNFPAWGLLGKAAAALLAGVPVLTKPATSTAAVAHRIIEILVAEAELPEGAISLLMGPAGDLLDHVGPQDVVAFTGSASTGLMIRGHKAVLANNVRVNIEADSLNAALIGPDVSTGTELFDLVVRDLATEITQKAGQKCTATRRIFVPQALQEELEAALIERLSDIASRTGDPREKGNRMGPLASAAQLRDARSGVETLRADASLIHGDPARSNFAGVEAGKGYFIEPILLRANPDRAQDASAAFHRHEVFGPVSTIIPYTGALVEAAVLCALGQGSLVSTIYSDDREAIASALREAAPWLGRVVLAGEKIANASIAPGCVFPQVNHGGPGRAGDGSELGGLAALNFYTQRVAVQGGASELARLLS